MTNTLDPVTLEVIRNALPAVANEMATDLQRTSTSCRATTSAACNRWRSRSF